MGQGDKTAMKLFSLGDSTGVNMYKTLQCYSICAGMEICDLCASQKLLSIIVWYKKGNFKTHASLPLEQGKHKYCQLITQENKYVNESKEENNESHLHCWHAMFTCTSVFTCAINFGQCKLLWPSKQIKQFLIPELFFNKNSKFHIVKQL